MIFLQQSNILEVLAEGLAQRLGEQVGDPLLAEVVVVPNPGMGRWLSQYLAEREGVAANIEYISAGRFFWRVLQAWLPAQRVSPFDADSLLWRIQAVLAEPTSNLLAAPDFAELAAYIDGDNRALRLFQLSQQIADVFDQYLVYRPQMVLDWEQDENRAVARTHWQAQLWRELTRGQKNHRARLLQQLSRAMQSPPAAPAHLSTRVSFFGLNALAPVYMDILKMLGQHMDISISHLNLSQNYWADIRSEKSQLKSQLKNHPERRVDALSNHFVSTETKRAIAFANNDDPFAPFLDLGNPLLASMGHIGQAYLDQLLELDAAADDNFSAPLAGGILHNLQKDILYLEDGREQERNLPVETWPSVQLHGCHTPLREVHVLHNNLLRCFEELDDLKPRDILVLAPNMVAFAPLIEAVFTGSESGQAIPFSIADSAQSSDSAMGEAISFLLQLPDSRLSATDVMSFLEVNAVQSRFGLDPEAVERIRVWVRESGIRWAADSQHRKDMGLPADGGLHSWQFGLQRLFLGYATPVADQQRMYADCVPYLDIEGGELQLAGALQCLLDRLNYWRKSLGKSRELAQWQGDLDAMFTQLFQAADNEANLLQLVARQMGAVKQQAELAGFNQPLPLSVVRELLDDSLTDNSANRGFLHGGVTFSNMVPMRSLPFRVIYMLGMNETDFPRSQPTNSFDLMSKKPQRGDRSRRLDDRYIFLEALCSARDCLFMSYQSRSVRTDKSSMPAETINELFDYLDGCYRQQDQPLSQSLFTQHPLQAFSPRYFNETDSRNQACLFSYDSTWVLQPGGKTAQPFIANNNPAVSPGQLFEVNVDELIRFYKNPARVYLQQHLDIRLPGEEDKLEDQEPFELNGLESWQLKTQLLTQELQPQTTAAASFEHLRGEGLLPHGVPGRLVLAKAREEAAFLGRQLNPFLRARPTENPLLIDLKISNWQLLGELQPFNSSGVVDYKIGTLHGHNRLVVWIKHLIVSAQQSNAADSILAGNKEVLRFKPISPKDAQGYLQTLLEYYTRGRSQPIPFFPKTSWAWSLNDRNWLEAWRGSDFSSYPAEGQDQAFALVFGDIEPFDSAFETLATAIYRPMINNMEVL